MQDNIYAIINTLSQSDCYRILDEIKKYRSALLITDVADFESDPELWILESNQELIKLRLAHLEWESSPQPLAPTEDLRKLIALQNIFTNPCPRVNLAQSHLLCFTPDEDGSSFSFPLDFREVLRSPLFHFFFDDLQMMTIHVVYKPCPLYPVPAHMRKNQKKVANTAVVDIVPNLQFLNSHGVFSHISGPTEFVIEALRPRRSVLHKYFVFRTGLANHCKLDRIEPFGTVNVHTKKSLKSDYGTFFVHFSVWLVSR